MDSNVLQPISETELFDRIDKALANADKGNFRYSEEFENELIAEFDDQE